MSALLPPVEAGRLSRGFSLIEVMVALVVFALIAAFTVPNFRNFVQSNNITASANNLMGSLSLARSEAVKRNIPVSVCASSTQVSCTGVDWDNGWIIFTDTGMDGAVDGDDEILSVVKGLPGGMELSSSAPYIQFKPNGSLSACVVCAIDYSKIVIATKLEDIHNWLAGMLYKLLPGKTVFAQEEQHQHRYGQGKGQGQGQGQGQGNNTAPSESSHNYSGIQFTICDSTKTGEKGRRILVSLSGQITDSTFTCN
ncbi:MAG: GspH/FimT family pseudopilin [Gammaproteobacteria bacterium]|nr:GspH/FimT family pseudopilin [Gammaproteobacteria bacterium]